MNLTAELPQRIDRLTPLTEALAWIDRAARAVPARRIPLARAAGRILADDVAVAAAAPGHNLSWRDGWAVRSDDTIDAGSYAPAILSRPPVRVDLGDDLPDGCDAVAPVDAVDPVQHTALVPVAPGEGVLAAGTDARAHETVKQAGTPLRLADIAALSALGLADVAVREPRVGIVTTRRDVIADALAAFLSDAVAAAGGVVVRLESIAAGADAEVDAILVVGGTGSGRSDASVRQIERIGRIAMHGIGLMPGDTTALGLVGERPVLLIPARVDAALAVWLTLGRRIMARMCAATVDPPATAAVLKAKITSSLGYAEMVLLRRDADGVVPIASGHLPLASLAAADAFVVIAADSEGFPAGANIHVEAMP